MGPPPIFYATVATVIPVLTLAAVLLYQDMGDKASEVSRGSVWSAVFALTTFFGVAIGGELGALLALYEGPGEASRNVVTTALVLLTMTLVLRPLLPFLKALENHGVKNALRVGVWVVGASGAAAAALVVLAF